MNIERVGEAIDYDDRNDIYPWWPAVAVAVRADGHRTNGELLHKH